MSRVTSGLALRRVIYLDDRSSPDARDRARDDFEES